MGTVVGSCLHEQLACFPNALSERESPPLHGSTLHAPAEEEKSGRQIERQHLGIDPVGQNDPAFAFQQYGVSGADALAVDVE
jgi:hypothetical protein